MKRLIALLLVLVAFAGCLDDSPDPLDSDGDGISDDQEIQQGTDPNKPDVPGATPTTPKVTFFNADTGFRGPEPSVGITSSGCIFFTALEKVMRSCDAGLTWLDVHDPVVCQDGTSDPWLWVDMETDRVFNVQMVSLAGTWVCWSDDDGESWLGNPYDQGPLPVNDHIKLASGPWRGVEAGAGYGAVGSNNPTYPTAVYFCYNKLAGVFCYTSFDGGATFPVGGQIIGLATTGAGLHGTITTAPDGTVYVPPRTATPTVLMSKDNGLTWTTHTMGEDVGTPSPRKNTEVGTDSASNAYHVWIGADHGVYVSRSTDSGLNWEQTSTRISPDYLTSATFPHVDAGDPGRVAITYLAAENFEGNPQVADENAGAPVNATYHLFLTYSLNGLEEEPTWTTVQVSEDPVQIGSICLNSGACSNGNRNLLDFNDLTLDKDGRIYIAYADGCMDECAAGDYSPENSRSSRGKVAIQQTGPSMFQEMSLLEAIST